MHGNGKTLAQTWNRTNPIEASYIVQKVENIETYFKALGFNSSLIEEIKSSKMRVVVTGKYIIF